MSDWESIQAEARELEAEDRIHRINAKRAASVNSASEVPPSYICEDCTLDGDCECTEEVEHEDAINETGRSYITGDAPAAVRAARPARNDGERRPQTAA